MKYCRSFTKNLNGKSGISATEHMQRVPIQASKRSAAGQSVVSIQLRMQMWGFNGDELKWNQLKGALEACGSFF